MKTAFGWVRKPETTLPLGEPTPAPQPSKIRIALLVASSALLSGIAVVLWNRRSLERIRAAEPAEAPDEITELDEFI